MSGKIFQPQMTQMNANVFLKFLIGANPLNLRLNMVLKVILEKAGL